MSTARTAARIIVTPDTYRPSTKTLPIRVSAYPDPAVAKCVQDLFGSKVTVFRNQVPKAWAMEDSYCQLIPDDTEATEYGMIPRIGAFEVTFKGIIVYSKLISQMWPHVPSVSA